MALNNPNPGAFSAADFIAPSVPWVTASQAPANTGSPVPQKFSFNFVTNFLTLTSTESNKPVRLGFSSNGVLGSNYMVVLGQASQTIEVKCKEVYVLADGNSSAKFTLVAGMTPVSATKFPILTGSTGFDGIG
jgi:hypothetical protein